MPTADTVPASQRAHFPIVGLLFVILVVIGRHLSVFTSLWLDELLSAWVSAGSFQDVVDRALQHQGQSPFYFLILWGFRVILGSSEWILRLPSLLALSLSAALFYRIVLQLLGRNLAWPALLLFVCLDGVQLSMNARPYALAMLCVFLSLHRFISWLKGESEVAIWLSVLCSVLAIYAHYFFGLALLVHVLIFFYSRVGTRKISSLYGPILVGLGLLMPLVPQVLALAVRRESLYFAPRPKFMEMIAVTFPLYPLVAGVFSALAARIFLPTTAGEGSAAKQASKALLPGAVFFVWWLSGPTVFYLFSAFSSASLFQERYFLWFLPGVILSITYTWSRWLTLRQITLATYIMGVLLLVRESQRSWQVEDWREAFSRIDRSEIESTNERQVLLYTGLVESADIDSLVQYKDSYLAAPVRYYPVDGTVSLLPLMAQTQQQKTYLDTVLDFRLMANQQIFVVCLEPMSKSVREQLEQRFSVLAGHLCKSEGLGTRVRVAQVSLK